MRIGAAIGVTALLVGVMVYFASLSQSAQQTVFLSAEDSSFSSKSLHFWPDVRVSLVFTNLGELPHNVQITQGADKIFQGEIAEGGTRTVYHLPPLRAGSYQFGCTIHPQMTGEISVE